MRVDVGAALPEATAPDEALAGVAGLAQLAERAGLVCLWAEDRLVAGQMSVLDSSLTLAAAAAVTDRIAVGFRFMCRRYARWPGPRSRSPACSTPRAAAVCGSAWA
jgi:hypothetical protein